MYVCGAGVRCNSPNCVSMDTHFGDACLGNFPSRHASSMVQNAFDVEPRSSFASSGQRLDLEQMCSVMSGSSTKPAKKANDGMRARSSLEARSSPE